MIERQGSNSNTRQAVWVGVSSLSSFLVGIISSAIFSRYFDKADYGTYKQIVFVYTTLLTLFSVGLPKAYAYFLPKVSMDQGKQVVGKLTRLFLLMGLVFTIFLYLAAGVIADLLRNPDLRHALRLFAVVPLFMMPTLGVEGIYTSLRKTHMLAIYTTVTRLGQLLFITIPVILFRGTYEMAIYGWMVSSLVILFVAVYFKYRPFRKSNRVEGVVSYPEILKYSVPLMVATLAGVALRSADQFFISRFFGTKAFADYANGFISLPFVPMITGAIHAVFVPLFSRYIEEEGGPLKISRSWKSGVNKAVVLIYPVLVFFVLYAREAIRIVFGPLYEESYIYLRLAMILDFTGPFLFYSILLAAGKTRVYANIHIVFAILIWSLGWVICRIGDSPVVYVVFAVILGLAMRVVGLIAAARSIGVQLIKLIDFASVLKVFVAAAGLCVLSRLASGLLTDHYFWGFLAGGSIYLVMLLIADRILQLNILKTAFSVLRKEGIE